MRVLDEQGKKCYYSSMENNTEISKIIAKNLVYYRKEAGLTQADLAEKINYSDKSVSKWESGNGVPDVYTLMLLAEIYGVSLNAFVGEDTPRQQEKKMKDLHLWIILLASGIVWLVATCFFVGMQLWKPMQPWWISFLYAGVVNAILLTVLSSVWKHRIVNVVSVSLLIWLSLTTLFFTLWYLYVNFDRPLEYLWLVFVVGAPLQVLELMWGFFRHRSRLFKRNARKAEGEEREEKEISSED